MKIYLISHPYKSEYIDNYKKYDLDIDHVWKIYDYRMSHNEKELLINYIINTIEDDNFIMIIYDNCIINDFNLLNKVCSQYNNVKGMYENEVVFLKVNVEDLENNSTNINEIKIDYTYYIDGKL